MRSSNHFILRDGKLVIKTQTHQTPCVAKPKIYRPSSTTFDTSNISPTINVNPKAQINTSDINQFNKKKQKGCCCDIDRKISQITKHYQNVVEGYEKKIRNLQKELQIKNEQIWKFEQTKNKMEQSFSTDRQSKITIIEKQQFQLCSHNLFIPSVDMQSQSQVKINIKTVQDISITGQQWTKQWERQSKQFKIKGKDGVNENRTLESSNDCGQSEQCQMSIIQCSRVSQVCEIEPVSHVLLGEVAWQKVNNENKEQNVDIKKIFDTSTLMTRLNRSASLVKNIKRFLQPNPCDSLPTIEIEQKTQNQQCSEESERNGEYDQIQLQKFIDELVQKHEEILIIMERLETEKQEQVRQVKLYYQSVIQKLEAQNLLKTVNGNKGYTNFQKGETKCFGIVIGGNKQNDHWQRDIESRKGGDQGKNKEIEKRSMDMEIL